MVYILHVERNKVDVSSHVKSSLYLFYVPFNFAVSIVCEQPLYVHFPPKNLLIFYICFWQRKSNFVINTLECTFII